MLPVLSLTALVAAVSATTLSSSPLTINALLKRQEGTSGAQYQCHSDCGHTILDASPSNCDNSTWTDLLSNCESCANEFNILRHYGDQVSAAGEECGIEVQFSEAEEASSSSSAASEPVSSAASEAVATTTTTSAVSSSVVVSSTTTASGSIVPSPSSNGTNPAAPAEPTGAEDPEEFAGAGSKLGAGVLVGFSFVAVVFQLAQ